MSRHLLSKSTFMRGCQCVKSLYLNKHQPELKDEVSSQQQAVFDRGTSVGELAQQLFPGGIDASPGHYYGYEQSIALTEELIDAGHTVIYEAAFQYNGVMAAIDILVQTNGAWRAYEVKSTTGVRENHVTDAALQYYVITHAGMRLSDISIIYINREYTRLGRLDVRQLFATESILDLVLEQQDFIEAQIPKLKEVLTLPEPPVVDIGEHCTEPYPCDFFGHCWQHIPRPSIFDLPRLGKNQFELYRQGIIRFEDIRDNVELNDNHKLQVSCHLKQGEHIDRAGLKDFLSTLSYPLYFLDFETFNPAIPQYDHSRPYQQIPFQYSIHYKRDPRAELRHTEFLASPTGDPRPAFIEQLLSKTRMPGMVITYNQGFERTRLRELATDFPQYAAALEARIERIRDLMPPFQQMLYYTPAMNGRYSIKSVLPALVPELDYTGMPINNGIDASLGFEQMMYDLTSDHSALRKNLLAYCKMDTLAMVNILERLETIANQ